MATSLLNESNMGNSNLKKDNGLTTEDAHPPGYHPEEVVVVTMEAMGQADLETDQMTQTMMTMMTWKRYGTDRHGCPWTLQQLHIALEHNDVKRNKQQFDRAKPNTVTNG